MSDYFSMIIYDKVFGQLAETVGPKYWDLVAGKAGEEDYVHLAWLAGMLLPRWTGKSSDKKVVDVLAVEVSPKLIQRFREAWYELPDGFLDPWRYWEILLVANDSDPVFRVCCRSTYSKHKHRHDRERWANTSGTRVLLNGAVSARRREILSGKASDRDYRNLALATMAAINDYCPQMDTLVKVDSNVFGGFCSAWKRLSSELGSVPDLWGLIPRYNLFERAEVVEATHWSDDSELVRIYPRPKSDSFVVPIG